MITLATLDQATEQEVVDQVVQHLLTQKQKAVGSKGLCVYRDSKGLKCAAGCLIADHEYVPDMEGCQWNMLTFRDYMTTSKHENLILQLQKIHDDIDPEDWNEYLFRFCRKNNLEFNPPEGT